MGDWQSLNKLPPLNYKCGYCGKDVASKEGYWWNLSDNNQPGGNPKIYVCGGCNAPSYFREDLQVPAPVLGNEVGALPTDIAAIYREARQCTQLGAYTACVLTCRKLLMHIAVQQ